MVSVDGNTWQEQQLLSYVLGKGNDSLLVGTFGGIFHSFFLNLTWEILSMNSLALHSTTFGFL